MTLRALWDGPARRTWLTHAVLGAVYTGIAIGLLRLLPSWAVPAAFTAFFYALREVKGIAYRQVDHVLDVLSPTVTALVVAGVLWVIGVRWL